MSANEPLCLTGSATIAEIAAQRDLLRAGLAARGAAAALDLSNIAKADVTLVQLVLAARADALRARRSLSVAAWSPAASDAFMRAGVPPESLAPMPSPAD